MKNNIKSILILILVAIFIIIVATKIIPIFSKPEVEIQNITKQDNKYKIEGVVKNGNKAVIYDNKITLSPDHKFNIEVISQRNNNLIIESQNKWGVKNKQIFYLEHLSQS